MRHFVARSSGKNVRKHQHRMELPRRNMVWTTYVILNLLPDTLKISILFSKWNYVTNIRIY